MIKIHNTKTGEIVERALTVKEIDKAKADEAVYQAEQTEAAAKEAARQALLDKLGITADEAKLLLG
jgi:hypothetical protein